MRPSASPEPPTPGPKLLVVQTSFLGDVVLTTPLLTALRQRLRPRELVVLVRRDAAALLEGHPDVDRVLIDDKHGRERGLGGLRRVVRRLRAEDFDLVVSPHRSLRTALMLAASRIPRRIGFDVARGAWLYHTRVRRDPGQHDVRRNLALMAAFGDVPEPPPLHLPVRPDAARHVAALLPDGPGPLVGIAPGSVWPTKRWTVAGFAALARALVSDGARVVLLGGPDDEPRCAAVARAAGAGVVSLAGRTDLPGLVAVVDRLALLVANDSAPMHVACARDVPVVAVFCATTPALGYGPFGVRTAVVEADLACRPCARHGGRRCPRGTEDCMRLVAAAQVLAAARTLLTGRVTGSAA